MATTGDILAPKLLADGTFEETALTPAAIGAASLTNGLVPATQLPPISYQSITHLGDGTLTAFAPPGTLTASDSPSAIAVTINGVSQEPNADYTLNVATNRVVLSSALPLGDKIVITRPILLPSNSTLSAEQLGAATTSALSAESAARIQAVSSLQTALNGKAATSHTHPAFSTGNAGFVPAPTSADATRYLKGDGSWGDVSSSSATGPTSFWIPARELTPLLSGGATWSPTPRQLSGLLLPGSLTFSGTATNTVQYLWAPPNNYNQGAIRARFYWTTAAGGNLSSQTVVWGIQARAFLESDVHSPAFGWSGGASISDTLMGYQANRMNISGEVSLTPTNSPSAPHPIAIQVFRDPANAADNFSQPAELIGVLISYNL